ncbi:MAG TPA: glycosyltransferase family 4 protein [Acidisarcina sp.]
MRILLTTDTIGGVWTFSKDLTQQLLDRGHSVALVSFGRMPSGDQLAWANRMAEEHSSDFLFRAFDVPLEWMQNNHDAYERSAEALIDVADCFGPDLLHANQYCLGAVLLDIPRLITAHSDVLSWAAVCRPNGLEASSWVKRYKAIVQRGLDASDAVAAPTKWMSLALKQNFSVKKQIAIVPNGRTLGRTSTLTQRQMQAVTAGRLWDEGKGLSTLLEIQAQVQLLIAGEENFGHTAAPRHDSIRSLGVLSEEQVHSLFYSSAIYVATSIYEPFGLAPLEAALCGCALVLRDLPSLREVWGEAATYFTDASGLESALAVLSTNHAKLTRAQQHATEKAKYYSAARMTNMYLNLYRRVINGDEAAPWTTDEELAAHVA